MTQARTVVTLQVRRGTNTEWNSADPTLAAGELGFNTTNGKFKIGTGNTVWSLLDYAAVTPGDLEELAQDALQNAFFSGTHVGISVTYDDALNKFSFEVDDQFPSHDTDDLAEGTTNLYFTELRAQTAVAQDIADAVSNAALGSTDDLTEGTTNLYFTNQRAKDAVAGDISTAVSNLVDSAPGLLDTLNELAAAINDDENFAVTVAQNITDAIDALDTDAIEEGTTNKYFTDQRALDATTTAYDHAGSASTAESNANTYTDTEIGNLTTDDIEEGVTNEYFTAQRAKNAAAELITNATLTNISITGTGSGLTISAENGVADSTTTDLVEGTNLYFTSQRALDATASAYDAAGAAATAEQNAKDYADDLASNYEPAGAVTTAIDALTTSVIEEGTNLYYTDERAQDAIGNNVGTGLTYNDSTGGIGLNFVTIGDTLLDGVSGASYGLIGTSAYLDVKNTNGYNKEIELDIAAVESKLDTDGYVTTTSTSTLTNKTLTSPKINEDVALTATATELNTLDGITVSTTELNYVDGVTSAIQDQIDLKAPLASPTFTGTVQAADINSSGNISIDGTLTVDGNLVVGGTTTTLHTATVSTRDNLIYLNQALDLTILGATHNGGTVEYKVTDNVDIVVGGSVRVTGVTPADYNISSADEITVASKRTQGNSHYFTVNKTVSVSYTSGGTAHLKVAANPDLGFAGGYYSSGYAHAGFFRDASDGGKFKLFQGYTPEPDETAFIDTTHASFALAPLVISSLEASSATIGDVTNTELQYVHGVTSAIQTQLDAKLASSTAASTYAPINAPTFTGTVSGITKSMVGLGNVDNTTDANKPVSTAQQTALDLKANLSGPTFTGTVVLPSTTSIGNVSATELGYVDGVTSAIQTQLDAKLASSTAASTYAPIAGPTFTGTVSGITKSMVGLGNVDNTTDAGKPVSTATQTALDLKANLAGPTFTGTVAAPTASVGDNSTKVATTAYVQGENIIQYVPLSDTTLTIASGTHKFKTITCTSSSATTVSIPTDLSDNWPIGTYVNVRQMGTGQVTIAAVSSGTTSVVATDSQLKTRVQYSEVVLEKTGINAWLVSGDTTA